MRIMGAAIFVYIGLTFFSSFGEELPVIVFVFIPIPLLIIGYYLFNGGLTRIFRGRPLHETVDEKLSKGKASVELLSVSGALSFKDLRTSSLVHFIGLTDGSVMCLYGQYLYDYEPISDDDAGHNQPRLFPTTEFQRIYNKEDNQTLDIRPRGDVVNPIFLQEPHDYSVIYDSGFKLKDGEVVPGLPLNKLRSAIEQY